MSTQVKRLADDCALRVECRLVIDPARCWIAPSSV